MLAFSMLSYFLFKCYLGPAEHSFLIRCEFLNQKQNQTKYKVRHSFYILNRKFPNINVFVQKNVSHTSPSIDVIYTSSALRKVFDLRVILPVSWSFDIRLTSPILSHATKTHLNSTIGPHKLRENCTCKW